MGEVGGRRTECGVWDASGAPVRVRGERALIPSFPPYCNSFHLKDSSGGAGLCVCGACGVCGVCGVCGMCAVCSGVRVRRATFSKLSNNHTLN